MGEIARPASCDGSDAAAVDMEDRDRLYFEDDREDFFCPLLLILLGGVYDLILDSGDDSIIIHVHESNV